MQVVTERSCSNEFRHFLDGQQYSTNSILRYERIFGEGFVSTGGIQTTTVSLFNFFACQMWLHSKLTNPLCTPMMACGRQLA